MGISMYLVHTLFLVLLVGSSHLTSSNQRELIRKFMKTRRVQEALPLTQDNFRSSELRTFTRLTRIRQSAKDARVSKPMSTSNETFTATSTTTPAYPPSDPNDACKGCPSGQVCQMFVPPCWRGPRECVNPSPDPGLNCSNLVCSPVALCSRR